MVYLLAEDDSQRVQWTNAWTQAGIPFEELNVDAVRAAIPHWNPRKFAKAWRLPDRAIRTGELLSRLVSTAEAQGVEIRTGTPVADLLQSDKQIQGVIAASGEEIAAGLVILATGGEDSPWAEASRDRPGEQPSYRFVNLKTHLMAIRPGMKSQPFCVLDHQGFNHIPHESTSIFGSNHWTITNRPHDVSVDAQESDRIRNQLKHLLPAWNYSGSEILEWAGTTMQAMHVEQIEPGRATLPTVIDHEREPGGLKNLLSVFPGRASLWPQLAEMAIEMLNAKRKIGPPRIAKPPWQSS